MEFLIFTIRVYEPTKIPRLLWNPSRTFFTEHLDMYFARDPVVLPKLFAEYNRWPLRQHYFEPMVTNGAPLHFSIAIREHLHATFGQRWVGNNLVELQECHQIQVNAGNSSKVLMAEMWRL